MAVAAAVAEAVLVLVLVLMVEVSINFCFLLCCAQILHVMQDDNPNEPYLSPAVMPTPFQSLIWRTILTAASLNCDQCALHLESFPSQNQLLLMWETTEMD